MSCEHRWEYRKQEVGVDLETTEGKYKDTLYPDVEFYYCKECGELQDDSRSEWQPIETAPKEGMILLCTEDDDVYSGFYLYDNQFLVDETQQECTHWMPLPEPPSNQ